MHGMSMNAVKTKNGISPVRIWITTLGLALAVLLVAQSCATTPRGKVQQAGQILIAMDSVMLEECAKSKANKDPVTGEWQPLTKDICKKAAASYKAAFDSWEATLDLLAQKPDARIGDKLAVIIRYLFIAADVLTEAGINVPPEAAEYLGIVREGLVD